MDKLKGFKELDDKKVDKGRDLLESETMNNTKVKEDDSKTNSAMIFVNAVFKQLEANGRNKKVIFECPLCGGDVHMIFYSSDGNKDTFGGGGASCSKCKINIME